MELPSEGPGVGRRVGLVARRLAVTIIGTVVVLLGIVMLFTPGPGLAGVAGGLAILATEYVWARRLSAKVRDRSRAAYQRARSRMQSHRGSGSGRPPDDGAPPLGGPTAI